MDKYIYFNDTKEGKLLCPGEAYHNLIDYAFSQADYFMLVFVNYYGKGYAAPMKYFKAKLQPFKVKSRSNPSWPGTLGTYCRDTTYKVNFYKTDPMAKDILKEVNSLSEWSCPSHPQDLAFFKGNKCWFFSVGHENIAGIVHVTKEDIEFLEANGLANGKNVRIKNNNYFDQYDELIEK